MTKVNLMDALQRSLKPTRKDFLQSQLPLNELAAAVARVNAQADWADAPERTRQAAQILKTMSIALRSNLASYRGSNG
jgi:hypothetical protein